MPRDPFSGLELLSEVTRDQVNEAASRTLSSDRAAVVIAGPYDG